MHKNKNTSGFTLIETLVGVLIFSIVIVAGFSALNAILVGKVKLIEKTTIQKEAFYFSEKLFEMIKTGGTIDYEEYWNRYSYDTAYGSGHFLQPSGFGNYGLNGSVGTSSYGGWPYYCISGNTVRLGFNGCLSSLNTSIRSTFNIDYSGHQQRYTQYANQYIDYNSDADNDSGDEDASGEVLGRFIGDDDDLFLGQGPEVFPEGIDVGELYLINADKDERTYFRFNVHLDSNAPAGSTCTGTQTMTGDGCFGTIEFLKLVGDDIGIDHGDDEGFSDNDGMLDTWFIHPDFSGGLDIIAGSNMNDYWQPLFPDTIHVKDVKFFPYPNKDLSYSWRDTDPSVNISPYVRISMTLTPSWESRKKIRGKLPEIEINTTVQLTDIFN